LQSNCVLSHALLLLTSTRLGGCDCWIGSKRVCRSDTCFHVFIPLDCLQPDAEELLQIALGALVENERFVAAFMGDDGRCLRERMRRIAGHIADRPDDNACKEIMSRLYGMAAEDPFGEVEGKRMTGQVVADWPIETAASKEQLQRQKDILKRLRAWEEVRGLAAAAFTSVNVTFLCNFAFFQSQPLSDGEDDSDFS
jgi:hypothetical protein